MAELYDFPIDTARDDTSPAVIFRLVGTGRRVLDVGGATGNLGRLLTHAGNVVTIIDSNPTAVEMAARGNARALLVDLETTAVSAAVPDAQFDVVVFADVLEHLRYPENVLTDVRRVLSPDGVVILSVPNVAHADVRLMLLEGRWDYAESGLLDRTHLRWFTRTSLFEMVSAAGFHVVRLERIVRPVFGTALGVGAMSHSGRLVQLLLSDPEAMTYQFVVVLRPGEAPMDAPRWQDSPPMLTAAIDAQFARSSMRERLRKLARRVRR